MNQRTKERTIWTAVAVGVSIPLVAIACLAPTAERPADTPPPDTAATTERRPTGTAPGTVPPAPTTSTTHRETATTIPAADHVALATRFVTSWLQVDGDPAARDLALTETVSPDYLTSIKLTDPAKIPRTTVASASLTENTPYRAVASVALADGITLKVTILPTALGWRVNSHRPT